MFCFVVLNGKDYRFFSTNCLFLVGACLLYGAARFFSHFSYQADECIQIGTNTALAPHKISNSVDYFLKFYVSFSIKKACQALKIGLKKDCALKYYCVLLRNLIMPKQLHNDFLLKLFNFIRECHKTDHFNISMA